MTSLRFLVGRLPVRFKFLLLAAVGLVAILVPTWQALTGYRAQIAVTDTEIAGAPATRAMLDVLLQVREVRALNALVAGGLAN